MIYLNKFKFSKLENGEVAQLFRFDNEKITVDITNYGAAILSIKTPDKNGKIADVVLGYSDVKDYENQNAYMGVVVGRYANRIAQGKFILNGEECKLATNDGENHLHGGVNGFSKRLWDYEIIGDKANPKLKLSLVSEDLDEGYPGKLMVNVIYSLDNNNCLKIEYNAQSDKDTIVNLTNHSYFNLNGHNKGDILRHKLYVNSKKFLRVDEKGIPTGEKVDVYNTPFDFSKKENMYSIGERIDNRNNDIKLANGYDHCFILNDDGDQIIHAATLKEEYTGRQLNVYTNKPAIQIYTGNFLNKKQKGKQNSYYGKRSGVCLETQFYPDSPNQIDFPSCILKQGENYKYETIFEFCTN